MQSTVSVTGQAHVQQRKQASKIYKNIDLATTQTMHDEWSMDTITCS